MQIGAVSSYGIGFSGYSGKKSVNQGQNNGLSVNRIISNMGNTASGKSISPAKSFLQSLYEQKKALTESKNELVADTLAQDKPLESIKSQLESYEEKLKNIGEQIKQALLEENQKGIKGEENVPKKEDSLDSGSTETQIYREMHAVMASSVSKTRMDVIGRTKNKLEGEQRVISSEIKQDGFISKSKANRMGRITEKLEGLTETLQKEKTQSNKNKQTVSDAISEIIVRQEVIQTKINTYNQNINPPMDQYPRALFNIMI